MEHSNISGELALTGVELVLARSDFLDAFAGLESAVCKVLRSAGQNPKGEPFSQRVKAFKSTEKTTLIAKQNHPKRDQIADEIAALLQLRADIVHSRMNLQTIDGELCACFINVQEAGTLYPPQRILKLEDLKKLGRMALRLEERIAQLGRVNPPSSPPPPLPGAAGGP
jgi:hypothetical protein